MITECSTLSVTAISLPHSSENIMKERAERIQELENER